MKGFLITIGIIILIIILTVIGVLGGWFNTWFTNKVDYIDRKIEDRTSYDTRKNIVTSSKRNDRQISRRI